MSHIIVHLAEELKSTNSSVFSIEGGSQVVEGMMSNSVFVAGLFLMIIGFILNHISLTFQRAIYRLQNRFFYTLSIPSTEEGYNYLVRWIANHEYSSKARQIFAYTQYSNSTVAGQVNRPEIRFIPAYGSHFLKYRGKWLWLNRSKQQKPTIATNVIYQGRSARSTDDLIRITMFTGLFRQDRHILEELLQEAVEAHFAQDEGYTSVYTERHNSWIRTCKRRNRSMHSVCLPDEIKYDLLQDAKDFVTSRDWYKSRGVPYRRGYLLYGPPGCGKSSFIFALAGELNMDIRVVNLSAPGMSDNSLNTLMTTAPPNSIILMEDIDAAFVDRDSAEEKVNVLSFSGLLNALDGVYSQEGRIVFMSTNHIERLDPALIRPGRIDVKAEFKKASTAQIKDMFINFYNDDAWAGWFDDWLFRSSPNHIVSPAELQGFFLVHKKDPNTAMKEFPAFLRSKSDHFIAPSPKPLRRSRQ